MRIEISERLNMSEVKGRRERERGTRKDVTYARERDALMRHKSKSAVKGGNRTLQWALGVKRI